MASGEGKGNCSAIIIAAKPPAYPADPTNFPSTPSSHRLITTDWALAEFP